MTGRLNRKSRRPVHGVLVAAAAATAILASCAPATEPSAPTPTPAALPTISDAAASVRGQLVSSEPFDDVDPTIVDVGATAQKIVYRSTSGIDGSATSVSGTVFVPNGDSPPGGRPVVTVGHGTTGLAPECGPSTAPDLLGYASTIVPLMKLGYVVVMSDYQGLGSGGGTNPYLDPDTSAYNLIDGVRAARELVPGTSESWAGLGVSIGGQATWAAAELADFYAPELKFVGSVALAPAADLTKLVDLAETQWLSHEQQIMMSYVISGLASARPGIDPANYLGGELATNSAMWLACSGPALQQRAQQAALLNPSDTQPRTAEAASTLRDWLKSIALPKRPAGGPLLVVNGDADQTIRPQWVQTAVDNACAFGDSVQHIVRAGQTHNNLDPGAETAIWLQARFRGEAPPSDC
ncbi:dienelactone hydrolase [Rhodococcus sp. 27YEA15]|uniref:lipase family protein n=1 Tax=Rhodococcus sp. 27YEA15 TaxID=3156259 RepID=UPI003C7AD54F